LAFIGVVPFVTRPNDNGAQPSCRRTLREQAVAMSVGCRGYPGIRAEAVRADVQEAAGLPPPKNASGDPYGRTGPRQLNINENICTASRLDSETTQGMACVVGSSPSQRTSWCGLPAFGHPLGIPLVGRFSTGSCSARYRKNARSEITRGGRRHRNSASDAGFVVRV
jgi:hypothetical protein